MLIFAMPRLAKIADKKTLSMKPVLAFLCLMLAFSIATGNSASRADVPPDRQVAITIDDLPSAAANTMSAAAITEMTGKLLAALTQNKVPAVGFVNEKELYYHWGEVDQNQSSQHVARRRFGIG